MRNHYLYIVGMLLTVSLSVQAQTVSNDNEDGVYKVGRMSSKAFVPGEVLVKFKDASPVQVRRVKGRYQSVSRNAVNAVLQEFATTDMEQLLPNQNPKRAMRRAKAYNGETIVEKDLSQLYSVKFQSQRPDSVMKLVERLKSLSEVEYAEPNYKAYIMGEPAEGDVICNNPGQNPLYSQQWGPAFAGVDKLWTKPIVNAKRPVIAILDTGVDITHPDLAENIWTNTQESEGEEGYDDDNDGFVDDVHGWDFVNNTPKMADYNSHGTHVAGIAAAADNSVGIVGANPQALIMPITVMQSDGSGDIRTIVKGIEYAVEHGASVINMSLGLSVYSQVLREALGYAYQTAVLVAAAGNDGLSIYPTPRTHPVYPAAHSFVLGVMATDANGKLASFSNFDPDGPLFSTYKDAADVEGINYEISAPGIDISSTIPNGNYKKMNGTSMATPLVAGAISSLIMLKSYESQEMLWGDLLHADNNFESCYNISERPTEIDVFSLEWRDVDGNIVKDSELDAGGHFYLYPMIRTTYGYAHNIKLHLTIKDITKNDYINIVSNDIDFGSSLSPFAKGISKTPIEVIISPQAEEAMVIALELSVSCDERSEGQIFNTMITTTNMVKIGGLIKQDTWLTNNHIYYVNNDLGVIEGATLHIEKGTRLEFAQGAGLSIGGRLDAKGTPEKPIIFTKHSNGNWNGVFIASKANSFWSQEILDTLRYCHIEYCDYGRNNNSICLTPFFKDCIISNLSEESGCVISASKSNYTNCYMNPTSSMRNELTYMNYINNGIIGIWGRLKTSNYFNNSTEDVMNINPIWRGFYLTYEMTDRVERSELPSYLGTAKEEIVRPFVFELGNSPHALGTVDLSNMLKEPVREAHGIVWKVVVNGYDAQDDFELLPPLGVGRHKFEVYFNRPMNKSKSPNISFGVREPYTQHAVDEDGAWNEEGTIYTAYCTITGKTSSDGMNRIYVYGAEDNEYFECPFEKSRFNILIQAAGSLATGFVAEPGMGRINLTWNNENNDFTDAMGFNVYRYSYHDEQQPKLDEYGMYVWDENWNMVYETVQVADTIRLNTEMLDISTTAYTDYDVTPGIDYHYFYRVLSTDLKEFDVSNVVSATPLTATLGDANGSGEVDVADVITTVGYVTGQEPKPFIFEAADMNTDQQINIYDVVGIIQKIMNPNADARIASDEKAVYTVEDGTLYVESPIALAGVQAQLALDGKGEKEDVKVSSDLTGFEHASAWLSDNDYLFLAYSMNGKMLGAGKHALLYIGDADVNSLRLSDAYGHNVTAIAGNTTAINRMGSDVMNVKGIYTLGGQKLSGNSNDLKKLPKGVYIINGEKVVK